MTQPEQQATGNTPAATPLDYAGPTSARPLGRMPTMLEWFVILGIVSLLIVILLPSHNGRRINSTRGACAANLRSASQAIQMYASDHGGRFPDTLGQLIEDEYILDVRILLCPACADTPAQGPTPAARAADLTAGGHLSYVYVGRGLTTTADPYTVVMYEHPAHHKGVGQRRRRRAGRQRSRCPEQDWTQHPDDDSPFRVGVAAGSDGSALLRRPARQRGRAYRVPHRRVDRLGEVGGDVAFA